MNRLGCLLALAALLGGCDLTRSWTYAARHAGDPDPEPPRPRDPNWVPPDETAPVTGPAVPR